MPSIILSVEHNQYTRLSGDEVDQTILTYFDPSEWTENTGYKGFTILNCEAPNLSIKDFETVPAIYEMYFRPRRNFNKNEASLKSCELQKAAVFEPKDQLYIILGIKKVNYETKEKELIRGVKFWAIDPTEKISESNLQGYPVIESRISSNSSFDSELSRR